MRLQILTFVVQKNLPYDFVLEIKNLKCFQHMRTISGGFGGHFGPIWAIFVEPIQKRGISEKNKKFHFFPVRVQGWLRWVALVTKLLFSVISVPLKHMFIIENCFFRICFDCSQGVPSRCPRVLKNAIYLFHDHFHLILSLLQAQTQNGI